MMNGNCMPVSKTGNPILKFLMFWTGTQHNLRLLSSHECQLTEGLWIKNFCNGLRKYTASNDLLNPSSYKSPCSQDMKNHRDFTSSGLKLHFQCRAPSVNGECLEQALPECKKPTEWDKTQVFFFFDLITTMQDVIMKLLDLQRYIIITKLKALRRTMLQPCYRRKLEETANIACLFAGGNMFSWLMYM